MMALKVANSANATLADVQAQIKHCMKLREDDPAALTLSDEIARWVVKEYGGSAISFSPILLSVAAVVPQCAKGGVFKSLPDWGTVADNDPHIISHPQFQKIVDYSPPLTSASSSGAAAATTTTTTTTTCSVDEQIMVSPLTSVTSTILSAPPATSTSMTTTTAALHSTSAISDIPDVTDVTDRSILVNNPTDEGLQINTLAPHAPSIARTVEQCNTNTKAQVGMSRRSAQKRKVEDNDVEAMEAMLDTGSMKPVPMRKRKFLSDEEDHTATGTIYVKAAPMKAIKASAPAMESSEDTADARGFWDTATRPAGWGLDDDAIGAPAQCDKCVKLNKACIVLPDKKVRGPQSVTDWKSTAQLAPPKLTACTSSCVKWMVVTGQGVVDSVLDGMVAQGSNTMQTVETFQLPTSAPTQTPTPAQGQYNNPLSRSARVAPSIGLDLPGNKPTACDIYDSIHDLGRRFDLLATNECVDELDSRLGMVEDRFDWRLNMLEAQITALNVNWRGTSSLIAHLTLALQAHTRNSNAHQLIVANAMHQLPHPVIPSWHLEDVASSSRPGTSTAE
ncbi:hypothetical protein CY34DRAFT_786070 [Suillus luteus UH-Slu-Lm8-n1]|uniref:Uncharacterized protein n=1 Tax=Suillus luteus UH-Slu-Lm8-n1 TaxID=930992 RepID=A0A0C9ZYM0_9AGAM|nr:hypothetical protein CY34DRAFT_786070 [Suillus luteus UH-Slu-Lm8-n1]